VSDGRFCPPVLTVTRRAAGGELDQPPRLAQGAPPPIIRLGLAHRRRSL